MDNRFGTFLAVMVFLAVFVPLSGHSMPTRAMDTEITSVLMDGLTAAGGEYAEGAHAVSTILENTGDEDFMEFLDLYLNITYTSNDTVVISEMVNKVVYVASGSTASVKLADVELPRGELDIMVNATIGDKETNSSVILSILDVIDLSIMDIGLEEGATYPLSEPIDPMCNVTYEGNVEKFADTVTIALLIETDEMISETVYDESMEILNPTMSKVAPGKVWTVLFPEWTPEASGAYKATYSVYYDTYNEENNIDIVFFNIADAPVIEGLVTAGGMPVPGVDVTVWTDPETKTTTDANGEYMFYDIPSGNYTIEFFKMWMSYNLTTVAVTPGETHVINAVLEILDVGGLRGHVTLPNGTDAVGAIIEVEVVDSPLYTTTTNMEGYYEFEQISMGNATVTASFSGFEDDVIETNIIRGTWNNLDLALEEIPFEVTFSVPDGEPGFPIYDSISVFFTRPIMRSSVEPSTLTLRNLDSGTVVNVIYSFADGDMTVVITPQPPLLYNTEYQVEVKQFLQDTNGDFFPTAVYITFITELDIQEVELVSFSPANNENEVGRDVMITAVFPVAMDADTINNDTFLLIAQGGAKVLSVITYDPITRTAWLDPVNDLNWGTRYSVSLDPDILAVDPSRDFLGFTWSFEVEILVTTGSLSGKVLDEDGNPFVPSTVSVKLMKGTSDLLSKNPDISGRFEFLDVDEGVWTLTITVNGYETYTHDYTITADQTTQIPQNILLVKEDDDTEKNEIPWPIIGLIAIVVLLIIVIVYYLLNRPKEAPYEEEGGRRRYGGRREGPAYAPDDEELAEGDFLCPQCGNVVEAGDTICPQCGSEFEDDMFECPECGSSIPADAVTCPECNAAFEGEDAIQDEEDDYYDEEEEVDITRDYEVEDADDDYGIPRVD
ncbi:MAG: carboxypeptidase regulatory-like domain-containing protein [Candidatus Thermoplasmatota archaeon]|nr:carboxypeptidase regulatory-like domain-containing protein [Candidatus Thermoplasmatota archaeon]